jgi:hypothetical protein
VPGKGVIDEPPPTSGRASRPMLGGWRERPLAPRVFGSRAVARASGINNPAIQRAPPLRPIPPGRRRGRSRPRRAARKTSVAWAGGPIFHFRHPVGQRLNLSSGAPKQIPSRNRKIPNFSGYKAGSATRNPGNFTEIIDPKQGDSTCQPGEKSMVLATFSVQIARFSRESRFFARESG